jgi:hypothetical protein
MRRELALVVILALSTALAQEVITELDGQTELTFTFDEAGSYSTFLTIPKASSIISATLDITGSAVLYYSSSSITGSSSDFFGQSVASGDFNGDSYQDLAVGTKKNKVYIYYGSDTGFGTPSALNGEGSTDKFGELVLVSDFNGDNYDDLAVGAKTSDALKGSVQLFYGSETGLPSTSNLKLTGETSQDEFGASLAAGNVNNDNYFDLIVGAPKYDTLTKTNAGKVYIFTSSSSGVSSVNPITIDGRDSGEEAGSSVTSADFQQDGYWDITLGAPQYNSGAGRVQVYYTTDGTFGSIPDHTLIGSNEFGTSLTSGDFNGDTYPELIVGNHNHPNGKIVIYSSSPGGLSASGSSIEGQSAGSWFGYSVAYAGDIDQDGYGDLIVGAPFSESTGQVFIYYGSDTGISSQTYKLLGEGASGDRFGTSVSSMNLKFAVGAPNSVSNTGKVYIYDPQETYPLDPSIDVEADDSPDYTYTGSLSTTETPDITTAIQDAVDSCVSEPDEDCSIEIEFSSESAGEITVNNIQVTYTALGMEGDVCTIAGECYDNFCALDYSNTPAACCDAGQCWNSESYLVNPSPECVDPMFISSNDKYLCTATAEWQTCDASATLCEFVNIENKNFVCIHVSTTYKWVNTSSLSVALRENAM